MQSQLVTPVNLKGKTRRRMRRVSIASLLAASTTIAACSATIHKTSKLGDYSVLSIDAKQRLVIVGNRPNGAGTAICAEPSPDALAASAAQAALGQSNSAASLGVRTQTIQLLRDGYYRICEGYLNGAITQDEYRSVIKGIDIFMITLVAIQSVGGAIVGPNVTLNSKANSATGANNTASGDADTDAAVQQALAMAKPLSKDQIAGIREIVKTYIAFRRSTFTL